MDDILPEFLNDTKERLALMESALARLGEDPRGLDTAIRQAHAIRGAASFMQTPRLYALIQGAERMLVAAHRKERFGAADKEAFARCIERMRGVIAGAAGSEPAGDDTALLEQLAQAETLQGQTDADRAIPIKPTDFGAFAEEARQARETLSSLAGIAGEERAQTEAIIMASQTVEADARALRRVTLEKICQGLPRLADEAAAHNGKQVRVQVEGGAIGIEGPIASELRAVLVHLARNAVAHGIETPDIRRMHGKPETGAIRIAAARDGNFICIDVSDDGAGLDLAAIRRRAVENGMIGAAQAMRLSDSDTLAMLFAPGFSTTRRVTPLAGCGIGLDAVKASIEALNGRLEIQSRSGAGLAFSMRLPTTASEAPVIVIDPAQPAHELMRPLLDAAGFAVAEGPAPLVKTDPPVRPGKERTA